MGAFQNLMALITLKDNTRAGTQTVVSNLNRIANALDVTHLAATKTFKIDNDIRRMGVQMGLASAEVSRLTMNVVSLSNTTGVSTEKVTELSAAYMATGRSLDVTNAASERHARVLTELVGRFGLASAEVVKTDVTLKRFGDSIEDLTDRVAHWQDEFNMPGMLAQMPKAVRFAEQMLTRFGKTTVGNVRSLIDTTLKLGASYAKTFGVDMAQSIAMASQQQEHFLTQAQQDRDVFLGLGDDFSGLTKAIFETGRGLEQTNQLMALGRQSPAKYAREILSIRDNYRALGHGMFAERFFQNVIRNSDEATRALLTNEGALLALEEANKRDAISSGFNQLVEGIRSIGSEAATTVGNLMFLGKTVIGLTFMDVLTDSFGGITEILKSFNKGLIDSAKAIKDSPLFKELRPVLVGIGKVLIGVGAAAGMLAATMSSLVIPFRVFMTVAEGLPVIGKAVRPISLVVNTLVAFAKQGTNIAGVFSGIAIALNDFGDAMRDPRMSAVDVLVRGARALSLGIVESFDLVLGGLPTRIAKFFFPRIRTTLGDEVRHMFRNFQLALKGGTTSLVGQWWTDIRVEVRRRFDEFIADLGNNFDQKQAIAARWGENIGRAIGTMAGWARDMIAPLFSGDTWRGWIDGVVKFLSGEGKVELTGAFGTVFDAVLSHGSRFARGFFDEALRPFSLGFAEVKLGLQDMFDSFRINFDWLRKVGWPEIHMRWLELKISFVEGFYSIKDSAIFAFDLVTSHAKRALGNVGEFFVNIKKMMADAKVWRAEAAYSREAALGTFADQQALNDRTRDIVNARREASGVDAQLASYTTLRQEGESGLAGIYDADSARRAGSQASVDGLVGSSRTSLADIQANYGAWGAEHTSTAARIQAAGIARRVQAQEEIRQRDSARIFDDASRRSSGQLADSARGPIIEQSGRILTDLRNQLDSNVRPRGNSAEINAFENYISGIEEIRGRLADATTPEDVIAVWNELKSRISSTGASGIFTRTGIDPNTTIYQRPTAPIPGRAPVSTVGAGAGQTAPAPAMFPPELIEALRRHAEVVVRISPETARMMEILVQQHTSAEALRGQTGQ